MPKKIDPKVKERCIQQMLEHAAEYRTRPRRWPDRAGACCTYVARTRLGLASRALTCGYVVGDTGIEPVTSSV